jgi:hypothetical protein
LQDALSPKRAWKKLRRAAKKTAAAGKNKLCPTVIHFSRFEEPYLRHLQQMYSPGHPFPFDIICTHQIIKILLPQLPRKGLRAVAGYFGHSVPELRRCASHIGATIFTWAKVVELLGEFHGIRTLSELRDWLEAAKQQKKINSKSKGRRYPMKAESRRGLPDQPGIYRMLRSNGDLLYIGKAKSLKQRVGSYFQKSAKHGERTLEMLTQAQELDITITRSALEAALLESDEIKQHAPPYNVALRQRNREIVFFSRDLRKISATAGEEHLLGPLPSTESLSAFAAIAALLAEGGVGSMKNDSPALLLDMPAEYSPGLPCFLQGVDLFKQRHTIVLEESGEDKMVYNLMRLGKQFRREKLEELALAGAEEENGAADETAAGEEIEEAERVWTAEAVASMMEGIIRFGAHLIRRSRWFCLLSESELSWKEIIGKEERFLRVRFAGGRITAREDSNTGVVAGFPEPPGYGKSFLQRRQSFDLSTYDRMRVVTTELRRVIAENSGTEVQLCLRPAAVFGKKELTELLKWV